MKSWKLSDDIRRRPELAGIANATKPLLEEVVGPTADRIEAAWSAAADGRGRERLRLTISDWTWPEGVSTDFEPSELASDVRTRRALHWLWGDLLQARNHRQIQSLQQAAAEG